MTARIIPSEEIAFRCDFPLLCNARGYRDAVEVGTDLGSFAHQFLSRFEGNWLFCIDPYLPYAELPHDRTGDMLAAIMVLMPFHGRFRVIRATSLEAAPWIAKLITPDFVYIDGSHEGSDVAADIMAWWDKIPLTGMLAGHDFDDKHPGVIDAVTQFAKARGLTVRLTQETDSPPSWYIYRSEPKELIHKFFRQGTSPNPLAS